MAFERLDSVVKRVVSRIANEVDGEGSVAAEPDAEIAKKGPDRSPAKFQGEVIQETEGISRNESHSASRAHMDTALPMGRRMTVATASPNAVGSPTRAAVIRLVIDNGGRPAGSGGVGRAAYAQPRGGSRRSKLVLVGG